MGDDELVCVIILSNVAVGAMGGGIAGKVVLGMPLAGAACGFFGAGFSVLTNKAGENAIADALRNVGKEVSTRVYVHESVSDRVLPIHTNPYLHPSSRLPCDMVDVLSLGMGRIS